MKKALSIVLLSCAVFAVISNPAHASPPTADHPVIIVDDMQTPFAITAFKYEAVGESFVISESLQENTVYAPAAAVNLVASNVSKGSLLDVDERIRMRSHYFIHEDSKKYPEYKADRLSPGFIKPVDRPAR